MQHKITYALLFISLLTGNHGNDQNWNPPTKGSVSYTTTATPSYSTTQATPPKDGKFMVCFVNDQRPQSTEGIGQYAEKPNQGDYKPFSPSQPITRVKPLYPELYSKPTGTSEDVLSFVTTQKPQTENKPYLQYSFSPSTSNPMDVMSFVPPLQNKPYASHLVSEKPSYAEGQYPKPTPNPDDILSSISEALQKPYPSTVNIPKTKPSYKEMFPSKTKPGYLSFTTEDPLSYQYNPQLFAPDMQDVHYAPHKYPTRPFPGTERPRHHPSDTRYGSHYDRPYYKQYSPMETEGKRSMFRSYRSKMPKSKSVKKVRVMEKSVPYPEELRYQGKQTSGEEETDDGSQLKAFSYYNFHP